jgi:hypothetical protein
VAKYDAMVEIDLSGPDGNAFAILGRVKKALQAAGASHEEIRAFREQATSGDYNHLLAVCEEWVLFDGWYEDDDD